MPILIDIGWIVAGLIALYYGAEWLVNSATRMSLKFGISPLCVGLTVVAFGTSAPELFVSLQFNADGEPDMSLGNVVGSNLCNIGLVLGISAFICALHVKRALLVRDMTSLIVASFVFVGMLWDNQFSRIDGIILFAGVIAYTIIRLAVARREGKDEEVLAEVGVADCDAKAIPDPIWKMSLFAFIGLVALYLGAEGLERGGVSLAETLGVPGAIISLTVIAFSTSVPELATSAVASLKKEGDLITGNIIGSCLFNLLCVIGITATIKPLVIADIARVDLFVMLGFTLVLVPMIVTRRRIDRFEGMILLLGYAGYSWYLWAERI